MNKIKIPTTLLVALLAAPLSLSQPEAAQAITINPAEDVMTSNFFIGDDRVRGYPADGRNAHRVSPDNPFGVTGAETIYISFDFDFPGTFSGPILDATLTVQSVAGGFGADAGPGNPFTVSAHGVDADPLTNITDDTNPAGPIDWLTFLNNNVLPADPVALTVVDSFGTVTFNVTSLINDWISGTTPVQVIALTGKNETPGTEILHGFLNNTENPGATFLTVTVPEPSTGALLAGAALVLALAVRRPRLRYRR